MSRRNHLHWLAWSILVFTSQILAAPAFAEMCVDAGAVFALSSDAHEPAHIGYEYDRAVAEMRGWGVSELCVFEGRERRLEELGN